tara:strand:- start:135 stop:914 length:780 start_codon:yes stop_codon:yes gene_type:complete
MNDHLKKEYDKNGFVIIRNIIDPDLVLELENHVYWLCEKYPNIHPEAFHHDLLVNDPFIHKVLNDKKILDILENFIGKNIALFGAHYIAKKPLRGKAVGWHQDGSYWPLEPMNVVSVWMAATASLKDNGCMRVIPGTQNKKLIKSSQMIKEDMDKYVLGSAIKPDQIDDSEAVDIELMPGDISIHNPFLIHGSNFNTSDRWRIGLTLRYIPTSTYVNREKWDCVLLRGKSRKGIKNSYLKKPIFIEGEHMDFEGSSYYK